MGDETNSPTTEWTPEDYARAERERRRYEIARDVLAARMAQFLERDDDRSVAMEADTAVTAADALIAALDAEAGR